MTGMLTPMPKGFEIALNIRAKMLWLRIWGACDLEFERRLELALRDKMLELSAQAQWPIWYVLIDASQADLPSDQADISAYLRQPFLTANSVGLKKVAYVAVRMPADRSAPEGLANERDGPQWRGFTRREAALEWLSGNPQSMDQSQEVLV